MRVRPEEQADAILKPPPKRRIEPRGASIDPMDRPCLRRRIEQAERARLVAAFGQVDDILVEIAEAAEDRLDRDGAAEPVPILATGEPLSQAAMLDPPSAVKKIEVGSTMKHHAWNIPDNRSV